ncbi:LysM peptidoglycan-binding domain-containing protein [Roseospira marina]|uniref:LysM peptidoglycan-binding domain-containing protein n=1 Tax=Roseospira marina TaxID=140057 RepID=A0A5M6IAP4_9PROT|nr:LysM peptidoglycan-binding domain-containing protein [Roseospira marina]KAA5605283.1 LysM peptidoglycan-binding domain-containing protein [Roseospira marina]MBB4314744.1 nucleoid-associated protein YgaU [Roseospira marina]MBB5087733.1 nucleoid-associated protein YgaU [Roseospira marina]
MDTRLLVGVIVATVVAVAIILSVHGIRSIPSDGDADRAVAVGSAAEPAGTDVVGEASAPTRPGGAFGRAVDAARDTLAGVDTNAAPDASVPADAGGGTVPGQVTPSGAPADPDAPTFDVVHVEPGGHAVIAGRAAPGATVTILDSGAPLGAVTADGAGQWVFVPEAPLTPGDRELSLEARGGPSAQTAEAGRGASDVRRSATVVVLSVPARDGSGPVVALEAPRLGGGTGRLLQGPAPNTAQGTLQLGRVDYSRSGVLALSGTAAPGAVVQLYMDNAPVARVTADASGAWRARPDTRSLAEKVYTLRVDQIRPDGRVTARVELPFQHTDFTFARGDEGETLLVVQPGNNLWRVARTVYGQGTDYTVIYEANRSRIQDPDLIYPGQVFLIPTSD